MSRPLSRVPWAIEIDERDGVYVWLDALTNYLTTSQDKSFDSVFHVFGKDITKFHCYYYPCLLMALSTPLFFARDRHSLAYEDDLPQPLDSEWVKDEQEQGKLYPSSDPARLCTDRKDVIPSSPEVFCEAFCSRKTRWTTTLIFRSSSCCSPRTRWPMCTGICSRDR
mgnify:CR=1 FL=1